MGQAGNSEGAGEHPNQAVKSCSCSQKRAQLLIFQRDLCSEGHSGGMMPFGQTAIPESQGDFRGLVFFFFCPPHQFHSPSVNKCFFFSLPTE